MDRSRDWWVQAQADLRHARHALDDGAYEWACFAAHQSAEKALKAVFEKKRQRVWGHTLMRWLERSGMRSKSRLNSSSKRRSWTSTTLPPALLMVWSKVLRPNSTPAARPRMQTAIQKRCYGSVTVYSVDEAVIRAELEALVADLAARPEVVAVILFGSLSSGQFGVGGDVDLLVILSGSQRTFLDRIPTYKSDRFPVDLDVFPYTLEEIRQGQPLACEALSGGQVLWQRTPAEWFPGPSAALARVPPWPVCHPGPCATGRTGGQDGRVGRAGRTGAQEDSPECA